MAADAGTQAPAATWTGTARARFVGWLVAGLLAAVLLLIAVGEWAVLIAEEPAPGWLPWLVLIVFIVIAVAGVVLSRVRVEVGPEALTVAYGLGRPVQRLPWSEVAAVSAIDVRPRHWGGWGYRWLPWRHASAAVLRAGPGLKVDRADGREFLVTVDDAEAGAVAAQAALAGWQAGHAAGPAGAAG